MFAFIVALLASLVVTTAVLRYNHVHQRWTGDSDLTGVQKFHGYVVPRIGGVGIGVALVCVALVMVGIKDPYTRPFLLLLLCATPAFLGGLAEDLTKKVGVAHRLLLTMGSAVLGYFLLGASLNRIDVPVIDTALQWWPVALLFTAVAIGGVANAMNIIDGYNGLSGVVSCVILAGLGYVASQVGS